MHGFNHENFGELNEKQINKLIKAKTRNKKGPITFSGGVYAFMEKGIVFFVNDSCIEYFKKLDQKLSSKLLLIKASDIPGRLIVEKNLGQRAMVKNILPKTVFELWPIVNCKEKEKECSTAQLLLRKVSRELNNINMKFCHLLHLVSNWQLKQNFEHYYTVRYFNKNE